MHKSVSGMHAWHSQYVHILAEEPRSAQLAMGLVTLPQVDSPCLLFAQPRCCSQVTEGDLV